MLSSCSHAFIRLALLVGLAGCHAAQPAYFSPSSRAYQTPVVVGQATTSSFTATPLPTTTQPQPTDVPVHVASETLPPQPIIYQHVELLKTRMPAVLMAPQPLHNNPDQSAVRRPAWLYATQLVSEANITYTANRVTITDVPTRRHLPKGVVYALAASALPYGLLLLTHLPTWAWVLSLTLPLAAMLLAMGSLTKIRRNKAQFHGRGWAALALILATSYVGMTLVTLAALTASGILWE